MNKHIHTLLSIIVSVLAAVVFFAMGLSTGPALIFGALVGVVASTIIQRKFLKPGGLDDESLDEDDLDIVRQSASALALEFRASIEQIQDPEIHQLAERISDSFSEIASQLSSIPNDSAVPLVYGELFEPTDALLTDYLWLQRRGGIAEQDLMTEIANRDLPIAEAASRQVASILRQSGELNLDAIRRAVGFSLESDTRGASTNPEAWGNRQRLVDEADRATKGK